MLSSSSSSSLLLRVITWMVTCQACVGSMSTAYRVQMVSQGDDGAYDFAYDTGGGNYHIESRHTNGTITGKFAYLSPDGMLREIGYTADDAGFRPEGDLYPLPPPSRLTAKQQQQQQQQQRLLDPNRHHSGRNERVELPPPHRPPGSFELFTHGERQQPQQQQQQRRRQHPVDGPSTPPSLPFTSKLPFPIAPLLSSGNGFPPPPLHQQPPSPEDNGPTGTQVSPAPDAPSKILSSALAQLMPSSRPSSASSSQASRLRQVRLKLLQLITLLETMEEAEEEEEEEELPPKSDGAPTAPPSDRFPSGPSTIVVRSAPDLATPPLFTPVDGVRQVDGERVLQRSYIPLTRRYGYVYSQQQEEQTQ